MPESQKMILVVDDERMVREGLMAFLEDEGFAVRGVVSAEEALRDMEAVLPDLVIADLRLPGISGSDLIAISLEKWPCMRFVIHTGSANFCLTPELREAGMTDADVFRKPVVHLEAMAGRIDELVNGSVKS